jgi:TRAP-type mannitol/chloroaromatic compound transport system substrate-binding protein
MAAIKKANDDLLLEFAAKDPKTKEILDSITNYQKEVRAWTNFADRAYLNNSDSK